VGRLENIIERNRRPNRSRTRKGLGVGLATIVVFVVLILLIFTDLATPPQDAGSGSSTGSGSSEGSNATPRETVHGVRLWSPPAKQPARKR